MSNLIWSAVGVLLILWLLGFSVNVGGGLIHSDFMGMAATINFN